MCTYVFIYCRIYANKCILYAHKVEKCGYLYEKDPRRRSQFQRKEVQFNSDVQVNSEVQFNSAVKY